jgi:hypothetical protein
MSADLMYAQFLQGSSDFAGKSMIKASQEQKAYEDYLDNATQLQQGLVDFSPNDSFDVDQMLGDAGYNSVQQDLANAGFDPYRPFITHGLYQGGRGIQKLAGWSAKTIAPKASAKVASKFAAKAGSRFIPGLGWVLAGADVGQYFMPKGYGPYDLFGLAPNNPISELLSW